MYTSWCNRFAFVKKNWSNVFVPLLHKCFFREVNLKVVNTFILLLFLFWPTVNQQHLTTFIWIYVMNWNRKAESSCNNNEKKTVLFHGMSNFRFFWCNLNFPSSSLFWMCAMWLLRSVLFAAIERHDFVCFFFCQTMVYTYIDSTESSSERSNTVQRLMRAIGIYSCY